MLILDEATSALAPAEVRWLLGLERRLAGALILTVLAGLLPILNLNPAALQVVYGVVILVTVALAILPGRQAVAR